MGSLAADIEAVRRFNRAYTRRIGLLHRELLRSEFTLVEARILYELAQSEGATASALAGFLALDAGYLSRLLSGLAKRGLIDRKPSAEDRRAVLLELTPAGRDAFAELDRRSRAEVGEMLDGLSEGKRRDLVGAMATIERYLSGGKAADIRIRTHEPGDLGWIVERHGVVYARDYGFDSRFEALVAEIAATFLKDFDPARERCWIAELDGRRVGSVMLVKQSHETAKLRLLLVEAEARGLGLGRQLVETCLQFARATGYRAIVLWTNSILDEARGLYESLGFTLVKEEPHRSFGRDLVGQDWTLRLAP
ncbi:MAG: bifunctional helix-turn-helix transcriptional regulator/GNAT family N-acetyltransferase [Rhizobiales bacterium]|nr:bifunctional helix-turn-helix transcriptional regulator/GNAT family N-acetyltransferase [Hyphomicrobiales bacterium]